MITDGCLHKKEERLQLLKNLINCSLPNFSSENSNHVSSNQYLINPNLDSKILQNTISSNWIFRSRHKLLCSEKFCQGQDLSKNSDRIKCAHTCSAVDLETAKSECQTKAIGFKLIRLCEMELIEQLVQDMPEINFKFVFLNRDPRGIFASREKIFQAKSVSYQSLLDNLKWTCRWMEKRFSSVSKNLELAAMSKFMRYETISLDPIAAAQQFYDFVGLEFDQNLQQQVALITDNTSQNQSDSNSENAYQTQKNSETQYQKS